MKTSRSVEDKLEKELVRLFEGEQLLEEEIKLDENCRSKWYRWSLREIDTYMKFCSLKLKEEPLVLDGMVRNSGQIVEIVRGRLQVEDSSSEPPMIFGGSRLVRRIWRSRLTRPICLILLAYYISKMTLLTYLVYKRDTNLKNWQPMFSPNATRKGECVLAGERHLESPKMREAIESVEFLEQLGNIYKAMVGAPTMLFQFMTVFVTALYVAGLFTIRLIAPHFYHLNFILNPHCERQRIRFELDKIVGKLVECLVFQATLSNATSNSSDNDNKVFLVTQGRRDATEYLKLLVSVSHLVKPANLSARWHQILLYLSNLFTPLLFLSLFSGFGAASLAIAIETIIRAMNRLEKMRCQELLGPDGILTTDIVSLSSLEDPKDLEAYAENDGSFMNAVKLGLTIESKYLITSPRHIHFLVDLAVFMIFTCIVFPTYELLYWYCVMDKLRWLNQVEEQLDFCNSFCNRMFKTRWRYEKAREVFGCSFEREQEDHKETDTKLVKCMTISYLNYLLFASQLSPFMKTAQVFITPMTVAGAYMMLLSYIIATQTESPFSRWVLVGLFYFVLQTNFYLATGALLLSKSQKLMRSISKLITNCQSGNAGSSNLQIIVGLWRRQLLNPEELTNLKGINIFGNPISFDLLRTTNLYILLLCGFLIKSNNSNHF